MPTIAALVASLHAHSGKTLLARVLVEHFILKGAMPAIFDTDAAERRLTACFPYDAIVIELTRVRDQMALFDTLAKPFAAHRVVDVAHAALGKFFALMRDTDFIAEAQANGVAPVIFYILDRDRDSVDEAAALRERFSDCAFVVVENGFLPRASAAVRAGAAFRALVDHPLRVAMPRLDEDLAELIEEPGRSLSALMREPLSRSEDRRNELSFDARVALRAWLMGMLKDIHRALASLDARAEVVA